MKTIGFKIQQPRISAKNHTIIPPIDFQHILCIGSTGTGKTASLILPTLKDRLNKGHTVIFFDHKGHEHKKVKYLAKQAGRLQDVVEIGKPHTHYINLLAEVDTIMFKNMIRELTLSKDPYWSNSTANLAEDIILTLKKLHHIISMMKNNNIQINTYNNPLKILKDMDIDLLKQPSFQTLSVIISSPQSLIDYQKALIEIHLKLIKILNESECISNDKLHILKKIHGQIIIFEKRVKSLNRFNINLEEGNHAGNNGVLEILNNTIASYSQKDFINIGDYSISDLIKQKAIIIIDAQSLDDDIMRLFFESIMKKSIKNLRNNTTSPTSIFIDEANRILSSSIDIHDDVLREAKVELILAIQNEEQMIQKFSTIKWNAIKGNIKHIYIIDNQHHIDYNNMENIISKPILIEQELLTEIEYIYYALTKNKVNIQNNFLGDIDKLPEKFTVEYDIDKFDNESSIIIISANDRYVFNYLGRDTIKKIENYHLWQQKKNEINNYLLDKEEEKRISNLLDKIDIDFSKLI